MAVCKLGKGQCGGRRSASTEMVRFEYVVQLNCSMRILRGGDEDEKFRMVD